MTGEATSMRDAQLNDPGAEYGTRFPGPGDQSAWLNAGDRFAAATRPRGADKYATWWKVWLPIPLLLVVLDLTFNLWFWHIPKLTGTAADYSYQYLYDRQHLRGTKADGTVRVVAFGSSVSSALDPFQVESLLAARGMPRPVEVRRLTKPGSKPSDHHLVWKSEFADVEPDVVIGLFNLVDFVNPSFERDLKPDIRYVLPPWRTLFERWRYVPTIAEKLQLAASGISNLYRYRRPIQSALEDNARALLRWASSRRSAASGYGWYDDGYTTDRFGLRLTDAQGGAFEYYIHPAWIAQRGKVGLRFSLDGAPLAEREETTPGWKRLPLEGRRDGLLQVTADSSWNMRAAGLGEDLRLLGVQLRAVPDRNLNHGRPPFRYALKTASDVDDFLRMGGATGVAYRERWQAALAGEDDFGRRFRAYRDVKLGLREQPFEPGGEFTALRDMVAQLTAAGVRVVLVNTPESPLLDGLDTSPYYQAYLDFFRALARDTPNLRFVDLHDALPAEDLNDWHHVNYVGQIKLGPVFAAVLAEEIAAATGGGSQAAGRSDAF